MPAGYNGSKSWSAIRHCELAERYLFELLDRMCCRWGLGLRNRSRVRHANHHWSTLPAFAFPLILLKVDFAKKSILTCKIFDQVGIIDEPKRLANRLLFANACMMRAHTQFTDEPEL